MLFRAVACAVSTHKTFLATGKSVLSSFPYTGMLSTVQTRLGDVNEETNVTERKTKTIMKVLQVVEATAAGVGRHVRDLSEFLVDQGHEVAVAYASHRADEEFQEFVSVRRNEISFVPLRLQREVSPASDLAAVLQLWRFIKRHGPFDVAHGHSSKGGAIARLAGRWARVPTVYTPHSLVMSSPEVTRPKAIAYTLIERLLGNWMTSKMIAVSEDERQFIVRLKLVPSGRVALVYNGVDDQLLDYFSRMKADHNGVDDKPLTFGTTIKFRAQKAPGDLVEAFIKLLDMLPKTPLRLIIAGDGELFAETQERVRASGLSERISLPGWRKDVSKVLEECDVFVLPSLYEGFSYAILEAMAARLPIVTTDVFGVQETVAQVPGNVVVPPGNPDALAGGMKRMAVTWLDSSRKALDEIGQANHDYVRLRFTQSETMRQTVDIYRELREQVRKG